MAAEAPQRVLVLQLAACAIVGLAAASDPDDDVWQPIRALIGE